MMVGGARSCLSAVVSGLAVRASDGACECESAV